MRLVGVDCMIIECEFTNSTDFARERVFVLTGMGMLIDREGLVFGIEWGDQPMVSVAQLHTAIHDSEFRIYLDRDGHFITMAKCVQARWTIWFIKVVSSAREALYSSILILQRTFKRWGVRMRSYRKLLGQRISLSFVMLMCRLHGNSDVALMVVDASLSVRPRMRPASEQPPDGPFRWVKPQSDGQILG